MLRAAHMREAFGIKQGLTVRQARAGSAQMHISPGLSDSESVYSTHCELR